MSGDRDLTDAERKKIADSLVYGIEIVTTRKIVVTEDDMPVAINETIRWRVGGKRDALKMLDDISRLMK